MGSIFRINGTVGYSAASSPMPAFRLSRIVESAIRIAYDRTSVGDSHQQIACAVPCERSGQVYGKPSRARGDPVAGIHKRQLVIRRVVCRAGETRGGTEPHIGTAVFHHHAFASAVGKLQSNNGGSRRNIRGNKLRCSINVLGVGVHGSTAHGGSGRTTCTGGGRTRPEGRSELRIQHQRHAQHRCQ